MGCHSMTFSFPLAALISTASVLSSASKLAFPLSLFKTWPLLRRAVCDTVLWWWTETLHCKGHSISHMQPLINSSHAWKFALFPLLGRRLMMWLKGREERKSSPSSHFSWPGEVGAGSAVGLPCFPDHANSCCSQFEAIRMGVGWM